MEWRPATSLRPYARNARTHSKTQVKQIADSIKRFGFTNPVLISDEGEIIAGHGRVEAAQLLGMEKVPTLRLSHLTPEERRAYVIADNKLALNAGWDIEILGHELEALIDLDFDVSLTGFSAAEIDLTIDQARDGSVDEPEPDAADDFPALGEVPVSRNGDLWQLGRHRLLCGDAKRPTDLDVLLAIEDGSRERADLIFTDPPYNVAIDGNVCGLGSIKHRTFAEGAGEMSEEAFIAFLTEALGNGARVTKDGAICFVCMDWRHMGEVLAAGKAVFTELKNLCVWNKTNGGMGSFYRSKHELVFVFKHGTAPHTNTFGLGEKGRYRTNVWDFAGINAMGKDRLDQLAMHPTVKPVAMIEEAIKDCSHRGEIVLDLFGGSGSTLMAAERCGRKARVIEIDPLYCDTIICRWQAYTGKQAILLSALRCDAQSVSGAPTQINDARGENGNPGGNETGRTSNITDASVADRHHDGRAFEEIAQARSAIEPTASDASPKSLETGANASNDGRR
ncbi:MAG: ParB N-terminal domain-containing protein [Hyphomicrobiaceae bacterium]|nr:ParB N-terminal domain-containing protein [Hyphomicrobiaceae bacterium]